MVQSNDYSEGSRRDMGPGQGVLKAVFLCKVALGSSLETTKDMPHLCTEEVEQAGKDSVTGVPSPTGDLNYAENVVYQAAAAIPSYLIVYRVQ